MVASTATPSVGSFRGVRLIVLTLLVGVLLPTHGTSQTVYPRSTETEWVYSEISDQIIQISAPDGTSQLESHRDGVLEVTFPDPSRARAVYRSLVLGLVTPEGAVTPRTDGALGLPFTLAFGDRGYEGTTSAPEFPPEFDALPDLTRQFEDFFMPLPVESLAIGVEWTDTATVTETTEEEDVRRSTVRTLVVTGDTIVDGTPAWVVATRAELELSVRSHVEELQADAVSTLAGVETGSFVFSKSGVMLARTREGELRGQLTYILADGELPFEQSHVYTTTITLLDSR